MAVTKDLGVRCFHYMLYFATTLQQRYGRIVIAVFWLQKQTQRSCVTWVRPQSKAASWAAVLILPDSKLQAEVAMPARP